MKKVGGTIWKMIKLGFLYDFEENLQSLEDKLKDLEAMKKNVEEKNFADTGEMQISVPVMQWLHSVILATEETRKIRRAADEIQNKCLSPMYCASSFKLRKIIAKKLREVEDLNAEWQGFGGDYTITDELPRTQVPLVPPPSSMVFELSPRRFTYKELELATEGFSESNFLGQGGFGTVHKGILPNKQTLAIKQQKSGSKQGMQEFQIEVKVISRVHHRHLVSLVGYCIAKAQMTVMLVYEFVPNKTLDFHLHGKIY